MRSALDDCKAWFKACSSSKAVPPEARQEMSGFSNFRELCLHREDGRDFQIRKKRRDSRVAIIAPHGGAIEPVTSKLAEATAGASFSWYCFEGLNGNRGNLHITSSNFDEPQCLK